MNVTVNIDEMAAAQLEKAAQASGMSPSQFLSRLIEENLRTTATVPARERIPSLPKPRSLGRHVENPRRLLAELDDETALTSR